MGAVYRAEDLKLRREVALKLLPPDLAERSERLERFQREARAVAGLNHPNIVTLYSVEEHQGRHFITMELVKGRPLEEAIPKNGLPIQDFFQIAICIADALAAAHQRGITHRDLKPANVMLDDRGRVKIIDFGLAKAVCPEDDTTDASDAATLSTTVDGRILGTPAYMSPEQVQGRAVDHRADLFALGILFHEMLTGDRPFKGDSKMSVMSAILREHPSSVSALRPDVPQEIARITKRCLQKAPDERAQSALDVRNELKELQSELISRGPSPATPIPQNPGSPARRSGAGIALAAAACAAVALAVWFARLADAHRPGPRPVASIPVPQGLPRITQLTAMERLESMPAWSPDGKSLAFVSRVGKTRQVFIRNATGLATAPVQVTRGSYDHIFPAWGPDTNTIYYTQSSTKELELGPSDAKLGIYEESDANIVRLDLRTGLSTEVVTKALSPTVAPGGKDLFFIQRFRVHKSDLIGGRISQLSEDEDIYFHSEPRVSSDGGRVVFHRLHTAAQRHHLAIVTTNHVMTLIRTNGYNSHPAWHPSGSYVYFSRYAGSGMNIWRVAVNSSNTAEGSPEPVTVGAGSDLEASFSPDGQRLAFTVASQNADVYRVTIDPTTGRTNGLPAEPMPFNSSREDSRASWAPNSSEPMVAFNSDRDGDMNIYIWRERDNSITKVTSGSGGDYQATWSPDRQKLVFFSSRTGNAEIYVTGTNANSTPIQLTHNPGLDINPFFSPDGKQIVFGSERNGRVTIYIMNADGSNQRALREGVGFGHFIPWFDTESIFVHASADGQDDFHRLFVSDGRLEKANTLSPAAAVGGHGSFSPDRKHYMDLDNAHAHIWVLSLNGNQGQVVYTKPPGAAQIDYPWWSSDGKWATFDVSIPRHSTLHLAEWENQPPK